MVVLPPVVVVLEVVFVVVASGKGVFGAMTLIGILRLITAPLYLISTLTAPVPTVCPDENWAILPCGLIFPIPAVHLNNA